MLSVNVFKAVADLAVGAKSKRDQEHTDFLAFYRSLVESLPTEAIRLFGNMSVKLIVGKVEEGAGLELTATDYMWWRQKIAGGARFVVGVHAVQLEMLNRLSKKAEAESLPPEQRKVLLALLDEVHPA